MALTDREAKKIKDRMRRRAAEIDLMDVRFRSNRKVEKKSKKGIRKSGGDTKKSVYTINVGQIESNRRKH